MSASVVSARSPVFRRQATCGRSGAPHTALWSLPPHLPAPTGDFADSTSTVARHNHSQWARGTRALAGRNSRWETAVTPQHDTNGARTTHAVSAARDGHETPA